MEMKYLRTFLELSKELNFTKTAEKLGYTQANVTFHIKTLEQELHAPLFNRLGKKITLTETGKKLLPMVIQMESLKKSILDIGNEDDETDTIRIGVCDSLCVTRVPNIISVYKEQHTAVNFSVEILKCSEFYQKLAEDQIDLAFTIGYLKKVNEIMHTAEIEEPIYVLCSSNNPLSKKKSLTPSDFSGIPLILAEKASYYRMNFEQDLVRNNITPHIMIETESIQAIKKLTESGLGVCILPGVAARDEIESGSLVILDYKCNYGIYSHIIWHSDKCLSNCQKNFLRFAETMITN